MAIEPKTLPLRGESDIVQARREVRDLAIRLGCTLIEQTKFVTATSEIARNTLIHGKGGILTIEEIVRDGRRGIKLVFTDEGPGIPDIATAMRDGYTTGNGMGLGLSGSKRLVHEFDLRSEPGKGTQVTLVKWTGR
ncbi:MAG TPA: anti-sigma regulatory factor [Rariglobus sp.]